MAQMSPCNQCQRLYFAREAFCPHCGATAVASPVSRFVRQAKMSGLMLFTALTTTACYGTPQMVVEPPGQVPPGQEQPLTQVPAAIGKAYVFLTGQNGYKIYQRTVEVGTAAVEPRKLAFGSGRWLTVNMEANADAFVPVEGTREALPLESLKSLVVTVDDGVKTRTFSLAEEGLDGSVQISRVDKDAVGGVLRLEQNGELVEIYFLAPR